MANVDSNRDDNLRIVQDVVCLQCGCLCDDLQVEVSGNSIIGVQRACALGGPWFLRQPNAQLPDCTIDGRPAPLADGYNRAAEILAAAKLPLIYGLHDCGTGAQRAAAALADRVGGLIDWPGSDAFGNAEVALQTVGQATCSWGEVAHRGDLIIFWGCDPAATHPRHFERYGLHTKSELLPNGRDDRTCVVVDTHHTATADQADLFVQPAPDRAVEGLWTLRALVAGIDLDTAQVAEQTGAPLSQWRQLAKQLASAKYAVFIYGSGMTTNGAKHAEPQALFSLVRDVNAHTRCVAVDIGRPGNITGAKNVLAWRTGYALGVHFANGYPRSNPGETTAEAVLRRGEVDTALLVGADLPGTLSRRAQVRLQALRTIAITPATASPPDGAAVVFTAATEGLNTRGTVYRSDGVPLPLRKIVDSPRASAADQLRQIQQAYEALRASPAANQ